MTNDKAQTYAETLKERVGAEFPDCEDLDFLDEHIRLLVKEVSRDTRHAAVDIVNYSPTHTSANAQALNDIEIFRSWTAAAVQNLTLK